MQVSNAVKLLSTREQSELTPSLETRLGNCHFSISLHPPISAACISPAHSKRDLPFLAQPSSNQFPVADMPAQVWIDSCGLSYSIFVTTGLGIRDTLGKTGKSREWNDSQHWRIPNTKILLAILTLGKLRIELSTQLPMSLAGVCIEQKRFWLWSTLSFTCNQILVLVDLQLDSTKTLRGFCIDVLNVWHYLEAPVHLEKE